MAARFRELTETDAADWAAYANRVAPLYRRPDPAARQASSPAPVPDRPPAAATKTLVSSVPANRAVDTLSIVPAGRVSLGPAASGAASSGPVPWDAVAAGAVPLGTIRSGAMAAVRLAAVPSGGMRTGPVPLGVDGQPGGVDAATWRRFRRGQLGGTRVLDLHGMTAQRAHASLRAFLRSAQADRVRCVEIVTGQGNGNSTAGGVLRRELPIWLNQPEIRSMVLAAAHPRWSTAMHANASNMGAVRLLLRRPRA